ncbi:MAG: glycoside hydrolase family 2 TIM barrel-domain containing protein [Lachnospiraceae bacterium]|nr:glycoside hydrolase family 2 TIM barrel-domain containing protein [Lachnospiraceae bacterium]
MECYKKDYPRPQLVRDNWTSLNGAWDFCFDDENQGEQDGWYRMLPEEQKRKIEVPFTYETKRSGIGDETAHGQVWYHRSVTADAGRLAAGEHLWLHFEGSDFRTKVWVNGQYVGDHLGGYARFSFDITRFVKAGENEIAVKVEDSFDPQQPRGKQRWVKDNFGCWYVQTTGIWKTVWLEYVPEIHLNQVKMTPLLADSSLELVYDMALPGNRKDGSVEIEAEICFDGTRISRTRTAVLSGSVKTRANVFHPAVGGMEWGVREWRPEDPALYDITFRVLVDGVETDRVGSYFAMREIRIDGSNILLNGKVLYQRLILDQGYWKDTHLTPPSEEALIDDIEKIQSMGYNGLRKHQKIEDERFLYWCDVKGMLVWSEMAAAYQYSDQAVTEFTREWMEIVQQNYNHPCIITWTPMNESWGVREIETDRTQQHFTEMIYHLTKSLDPYRPVIVNDGWEHTVSDILTLHDYEEVGETLYQRYTECKEQILTTEVYHSSAKSAFANGFHYQGQPILISEYGGIAFNNDDNGWGYGNKVSTKEEFLRRFEDITTAVKRIPYCCGFCYTQVSDVQQEINGLLDADHNYKLPPEAIREINERKVGYWRSEM